MGSSRRRENLASLVLPILSHISALGRAQKGQTLTEYALILAFFSVAMILALGAFHNGLTGLYNSVLDRWPSP
jgi:Flp pilus assembly pilin Flp